jgi:LmbE family N-acetylglucosaminyl deacetylase
VRLAFASVVRRVVCLGAHPDDVEIGAGGTLLWLADAYPAAQFQVIVLTGDGERAREAEHSTASLLGDRGATLCGRFEDSYLPYRHPDAVKEFIISVAEREPDLVIAPNLEDAHQDHELVARLAWQIFRGPTILEYELPKFESDRQKPNLYVPLSAELIERKLSHLADHFPSQHEKPWYDRQVFEGIARLREWSAWRRVVLPRASSAAK